MSKWSDWKSLGSAIRTVAVLMLVSCREASMPPPIEPDASMTDVPPAPPPEAEFQLPREGTRLRIARIEAGDAPPYPLYFVDSSFTDGDCEFLGIAGGRLRCVPRQRATPVYLDEACTDVGVVVDYYGDYATIFEDACAEFPNVRLVRIGTENLEPYYEMTPGGCQRNFRYARVRRIIEEVDPESFVAGEMMREGSGRLQRTVVESDDGARMIIGIFDSVLGKPCTPQHVGLRGNDGTYCVPGVEGDHLGVFYRDAECTDVVGTTIASCPEQVIRHRTPDDECSWRRIVAAATSGDIVENVFEKGLLVGGACQPGTSFDPVRPASEIVPGELFAPVEFVAFGSGRMKLLVSQTPDGFLLFPKVRFDEKPQDLFFDSAHGLGCGRVIVEGSPQRCIPQQAAARFDPADGFFSDTQCANPLAAWIATEQGPPAAGVALRLDGSVVQSLHQLGPVYTSTVVFKLAENGACSAVALADCVQLRTLGDRIPAADFVETPYIPR
jgi:hypothetical protein